MSEQPSEQPDTVSAGQRRQELMAELAKVDEQEQDERAQLRQRQPADPQAQLDPELRARKEEIERRANEALDHEYPPAWQPQKPDCGHAQQIVGLVLRIDLHVGPSKGWGTYSAVIEVRATDGGEWTIWANEGGALHARLLRLRVQPGEVIGVRYRGKKESSANPGQSYHDFRLVRVEDDDGPAAPIDYDALTRGQETPALPEGEQAPAVDDDIPF